MILLVLMNQGVMESEGGRKDKSDPVEKKVDESRSDGVRMRETKDKSDPVSVDESRIDGVRRKGESDSVMEKKVDESRSDGVRTKEEENEAKGVDGHESDSGNVENDGRGEDESSNSSEYSTARMNAKTSNETFEALSSSSIEVLAKFQAINEPSMDVDVASSVTLNGDGEEIRDKVNAEKPKYLRWSQTKKYSDTSESDEESLQPVK